MTQSKPTPSEVVHRVLMEKFNDSGIRLKNLADRAGINHGNAWRYFNQTSGYRKTSFNTVYSLAKALEVSLAELDAAMGEK